MKFSKIKDNDIANGIGITMSLWTQGCPHHCKGCFNGETWDFNSGKEFKEEDLDYILENINKNSVRKRSIDSGGRAIMSSNLHRWSSRKYAKDLKKNFQTKKSTCGRVIL